MPRAKTKAAALAATCDDVEAQFYEALQQGDLERLMSVWADDEEIVCVHPGGGRVVGAAAIRESFEAIFSHAPIPVTPTATRRVEAGGCVVHSVIECVQVQAADGVQSAWVVATNVFIKTVQGWRLVAHHASPGTATEPPELSLSAGSLH
jgi:ketosteroid isomerase-like protein